jgi:hypothetical protein
MTIGRGREERKKGRKKERKKERKKGEIYPKKGLDK